MDLLSYREKQDEEEPSVFSISELNREIKKLLEGRFAFLWVRGEISNFKAHSSGHYYFSLKDKKSQMNAVMFKGYNRGLRFQPEDGMEVLVRGRVTVYEPRGNYQILCETMEPVGAGALQLAFEKLKAKLKAEGLFESERKKALPALPSHVALVTSPTGAAVRDMLNVLKRRFRGLQVTVVPCQVQGAKAAETIVQALEKVELLHIKNPVDVVICGRGGGSLEDLWAFNEEILARKIAEFSLPIVSAVGHEIDFTIADFVADLRAPTPSAAAELVVRNAGDLQNQLAVQSRRLVVAMKNLILSWRRETEMRRRRLVDPKRTLQDLFLRCDDLLQKLEMATFRYLSDRHAQVLLLREKLTRPDQRLIRERQNLEALSARLNTALKLKLIKSKERMGRATAVLESISPLKVVERGYAIVTEGDKVVKSAAHLKVGDSLQVRLAKGRVDVEIKKIYQ